MPQVIEINRIEELEEHQLFWRLLLEQTRGASFFQSLDWLKAYWQHFGEGQQLRTLFVYSDGGPIGILPLTVLREKTRLGRVRVLTYPLRDWASFYGPIGPNPTATLNAAMRYLRSTRGDWDLLDMRWVSKESDHGRTPLAMQIAGFPMRERIWKTTQLIDLTESFDEYLATRTSRFRNNLHRSETRAARLGRVNYERYRPLGSAHDDGDPNWDLYDECLELAERSWQGSSRCGTTLSHKTVRQFFRDTHAKAAHSGAVDINALRVNGRFAAFNYNYHYAGRVFGVRQGYDREFAEISPGTLLFARSLQDSFARGDQLFDLGAEPAEYKCRWRTRSAPSYCYTHYAPRSPRSQLLRLKHQLWPREAMAKSKAKA